jgi:DsbC/DsbD-like thiol-disulfide interchange protein
MSLLEILLLTLPRFSIERTTVSKLLYCFTIFLGLAWIVTPFGAARGQTRPVGKMASVRIVQGESNADGSIWGELEIILAPHVKTYWRTAGETGLPPRFDWSASDNLADLQILWPSPVRFEDGGGQSIGYNQSVVLPVLIKPVHESKPVTLDLTVDYAVCEKLCVPVHDHIKAIFDKSKPITQDTQAVIQHALLTVPKKLTLGTSEYPSIERVIGEGDMLRIDANLEPETHIEDIFVEGPDGWVFAAPVLLAPPVNGRQSVLVSVLERPNQADPLANLTLSLTIVTRNMASETVLSLDKQGRAP